PEALLTGPPDRVAAVLNPLRGRRMARTRGLFRSSRRLDPARFKFQAVPRARGVGVVSEALSLLPHVDEVLAARDVARVRGLPVADTVTALSRLAGVPLYWLGKVPIALTDLVRPKKTSELVKAVRTHRPRQPGDKHAMVLVSPGLGLYVLSTWSPSTDQE